MVLSSSELFIEEASSLEAASGSLASASRFSSLGGGEPVLSGLRLSSSVDFSRPVSGSTNTERNRVLP